MVKPLVKQSMHHSKLVGLSWELRGFASNATQRMEFYELTVASTMRSVCQTQLNSNWIFWIGFEAENNCSLCTCIFIIIGAHNPIKSSICWQFWNWFVTLIEFEFENHLQSCDKRTGNTFSITFRMNFPFSWCSLPSLSKQTNIWMVSHCYHSEW